jgi:hypothetical protein
VSSRRIAKNHRTESTEVTEDAITQRPLRNAVRGRRRRRRRGILKFGISDLLPVFGITKAFFLGIATSINIVRRIQLLRDHRALRASLFLTSLFIR